MDRSADSQEVEAEQGYVSASEMCAPPSDAAFAVDSDHKFFFKTRDGETRVVNPCDSRLRQALRTQHLLHSPSDAAVAHVIEEESGDLEDREPSQNASADLEPSPKAVGRANLSAVFRSKPAAIPKRFRCDLTGRQSASQRHSSGSAASAADQRPESSVSTNGGRHRGTYSPWPPSVAGTAKNPGLPRIAPRANLFCNTSQNRARLVAISYLSACVSFSAVALLDWSLSPVNQSLQQNRNGKLILKSLPSFLRYY